VEIGLAEQSAASVETLDLSHNAGITERGAEALAMLLEQASATHKRAVAAAASTTTTGRPDRTFAVRASRDPTELRHLRTLVLSHCKLGDKGAAHLAAALPNNVHLTELDMAGCGVGPLGAVSLTAPLSESGKLTQLRLGWNRIGGKGATALAAALADNPALEILDVSHNALGDVGGAAMGELVRRSETLTHLHLAGNNLQEQACVVLTAGLLKNTSLVTLRLEDNPLGWAGGAHLVHALAGNDTLKTLGLQRCRLTRGVQKTPLLDRGAPGGVYTLQLGEIAHRVVLRELLALREELGPKSWKGVQLNGKPKGRAAVDKWMTGAQSQDDTAELPTDGTLTLTLDAPPRPVQPAGAAVVDAERIARRLLPELREPEAEDEWRLLLLRLMAARAAFRTEQLAAALDTLRWSGAQAAAAVAMFPALADPHCLHLVVDKLPVGDRLTVVQQLGFVAFFSPRNLTGTESTLTLALALTLTQLGVVALFPSPRATSRVRSIHSISQLTRNAARAASRGRV